jgi:hypothetical protein
MTALAPISKQIWDMKYRFRSADGSYVEDGVHGAELRQPLPSLKKTQNTGPTYFIKTYKIILFCQQDASLPEQVQKGGSHCLTASLWGKFPMTWPVFLTI